MCQFGGHAPKVAKALPAVAGADPSDDPAHESVLPLRWSLKGARPSGYHHRHAHHFTSRWLWGSSGLNLKGEPERAGGRFFEPVHQTVESILDTLSESSIQNKHDAHTPPAVATIDVRTQERLAGDAEVITSAGVSAGIDLAPAPRGPSGRRRGRGTVRRGTDLNPEETTKGLGLPGGGRPSRAWPGAPSSTWRRCPARCSRRRVSTPCWSRWSGVARRRLRPSTSQTHRADLAKARAGAHSDTATGPPSGDQGTVARRRRDQVGPRNGGANQLAGLPASWPPMEVTIVRGAVGE